jgi:transglutaminase-like putative cysteine protease
MPATSPAASLHWLLSPFVRLATRLSRRESAWERVTMQVPASVFGPGSRQPFADYLDGESRVPVRGLDDIVAWLQTCEYVTDLELFQEPDVWQHPGAFEHLRRGDCEDFALWAWRKLAEVGIDAEFYVGRVVCGEPPGSDRQHAWVVYRVDGAEFLFEPAARTTSNMIRPLADAMGRYVPHFAVNHRLHTTAFAGCAVDGHRGGSGRRNPTRAA